MYIDITWTANDLTEPQVAIHRSWVKCFKFQSKSFTFWEFFKILNDWILLARILHEIFAGLFQDPKQFVQEPGSYTEGAGKVVILLRGVNFGFLVSLRVLTEQKTTLAVKVLFRGAGEEI